MEWDLAHRIETTFMPVLHTIQVDGGKLLDQEAIISKKNSFINAYFFFGFAFKLVVFRLDTVVFMYYKHSRLTAKIKKL